MNKRRRRGSPWLIALLLIIIGALVYMNIFVVPNVNPPFVPTPTPTRPPESYEQEADQLTSEGKFIAAIEAYQSAINANPHNIDNYLKVSRLLIYTGRYGEARVNAENAILLDNKRAEAYAMLGWAKGFEKNYLEGERDARRAIELDPNSSLAHAVTAYLLGLRVEAGLEDLNTIDEAIEESRTALALNPNSLEVHWARGYVLEITSNYSDAAEEYEAAVAINPYISLLHMALGRNYFTLERLDDAILEFTRANALNPLNPDANYYISLVWARNGEYAKAIQYALEALKTDATDPYLYANVGTLYYRQELYNQSIPYLELAVRGGVAEDGSIVQGLVLDYNRSIIEIYSRYGLALARVNRCQEAMPVANGMLQTIADDENGKYNANEILRICQENLTNPPTPTPTLTPTMISGPTPTPEGQATPTPTP